MDRLCNTCQQVKLFDSAAKYQSKASGFYGTVCWACYTKAKALKSKAIRSTPLGYAAAKQSRIDAYTRRQNTPEKRLRYNNISRTYKAQTRSKQNALHAKYKAAKLQQVPAWADLAAIKFIYQQAAEQGLTVDHIVPLRGKTVSGLHVHYNLQLLTKAENSAKGNYHG